MFVFSVPFCFSFLIRIGKKIHLPNQVITNHGPEAILICSNKGSMLNTIASIVPTTWLNLR